MNEPADEPDGERTERPPTRRQKNKDEVGSSKWMIRRAADFSFIGIEFGIATAIGYFLGRYLDEQFDTKPYLTMFLALCGVAAASIVLFKLVQRARREDI